MSIRELAARHGVHRRAVHQALASAVPSARKDYARRYRPAMDPWVEVIDGWPLGEREVPRKQHHTARRIWQRLVAEHGAGWSEVTVSRYVARRRVELGLDRAAVMVPLRLTCRGSRHGSASVGSQAFIGGILTMYWLFVMRLSDSGRENYCNVFPQFTAVLIVVAMSVQTGIITTASDPTPDALAGEDVLIMLGLAMIALSRQLLIGFADSVLGYTLVVTLMISALLWWLALTVMVSAAALRWQVAQDRVGVRSGRHTVTARHRQR